MGGVHPTLAPEQCLQHCTSVVRGEAESIWKTVLYDAQNQNLKPLYHGDMIEDMSLVPIPGRNFFKNPNQPAAYFQATRGCGGTCDFCYLNYTGWNSHRKRNVADVIGELKLIPQRFILIVDDNLFVDRDYAIQLLREMAPIKKYWWAQAPTTICFDEELLQAAYNAGCFALSIGFQTINKSSLDLAKITQNRIEKYRQAVQNVHSHKILIDGTFIFGFDSDPPTIFANTVQAVRNMKLDAHTFYMLTPYPGTPYYQRLKDEGRIVDHNLAHYDWDHAVIQPRLMTADQLNEGVAWAYDTLSTSPIRWLIKHLARNSWLPFRSLSLAWFLLKQNFPQRYSVDY